MMSEPEVQFLDVGEGTNRRLIAYLHQKAAAAVPASSDQPSGKPAAEDQGAKPGLLWLQGFRSEMTSLKAEALVLWASKHGLALTRFDYSGHGRSPGRFIDATIGDWLAECEAVFTALTKGPQILVGSSMGGWLALLLLHRLRQTFPKAGSRIKGMVLLAPAWDMTQALMWDLASDAVREEICKNGIYMRPSAYGDEPYPISLQLIEEGRNHLIADKPFDPGVPIHILHGALDLDVPLSHSKVLQALLPGDHVVVREVDDGEHRLSRRQDLELLCTMIGDVLDAVRPKGRDEGISSPQTPLAGD